MYWVLTKVQALCMLLEYEAEINSILVLGKNVV